MLISNNNYARNADFVFAETVDHETFNNLSDSSLYITDKSKEGIAYKATILKIADGDSIFCRTDYLDELFYLIKKSNTKNLKLITHQTDIDISDKLEKNLPKNFIYWFGINKNTMSKRVISIPIGIAGNFSDKNLQVKDFDENKIKNFDLNSKELKIYVNFQKNTNSTERELAIDVLKKSDKSFFSEPNLPKSKYKEHLERFAFTLCPWGNGYDTHRVWEALYSGSVPIIKRHSTFEYLENLPALIIDDYEDLLKIDLNECFEKFQINKLNLEKLTIEYWVSQYKNEKQDIQKETIYIKYYITLYFHLKLKIKNKLNSNNKKISYYLRKIKFKVVNLYKN